MFFLIDKPLGISSYDVIRSAKKILQTKRIGHAGTLDPLATGCLLIATDKSTKLLHLLDGSRKRYRFTVNISGSTPSYDLGTPVIQHALASSIERTPGELRDFLLSQTEQVPPLYSALHIDGERAYELARRGEVLSLPSRPITVEDVTILRLDPPEIEIELTISSGGYIRSFAPLIGEFFGTPGGYITSLRRIQIMTPYAELSESMCIPIEAISFQNSSTREVIFPSIQSYVMDAGELQDIKQ